MKRHSVLIFSLFIASYTFATPQTFVEKDLGNSQLQGLKFIHDQAILFVRQYNQKHHTHWKALEPNAKTVVPKCKVALKTQWLVEDKTYLSTKRDIGKVAVKCAKTVDGSHPWSVHVETTRNH